VSALPAARAELATAAAGVVDRLLARFGAGEEERVRTGVRQVEQRWWPEDGDAASFAAFCEAQFVADPALLAASFARMAEIGEEVDGRLHEARRELTRPLDLDLGPLRPLDPLLAQVDLGPHLDESLFSSKAAFFLLLNFPIHTISERLAAGGSWQRDEWARSRMMDRFAIRVPAVVAQQGIKAFVEAERYVSGYNIRVDRLLGEGGATLFPEGLRLIAHWGLRDELAAHYADADPARGLACQRLLQTVMQRIVRQEVPAIVIDNGELRWDPRTNAVFGADGGALSAAAAAAEPNTRYQHLLAVFHAQRAVDPYSPQEPTFLTRRFERDRQMLESDVVRLLVEVLQSSELCQLAALIRGRLGRPLEPFDLWYPGFKPRARHTEAELDRAVQQRYPDLDAFARSLPEVLQALGFAPAVAEWLAAHMVVDPARGAGHAVGAVRRADAAHLRTRVPPGGMDYKGYNVALHELGHNIEQVFSLNGIDHWWLAGVPNTAFTECFAFACQHRDLELLGLGAPAAADRGVAALASLWTTAEIAGVSLVDLGAWHWLYEHPEASPAELRDAVLAIARTVWNRHFLPIFGAPTEDTEILAIYSHMIAYALYLPDYALGHLIEFQLGEVLTGPGFGPAFERIAKQGRLTPDAWMRGAVGKPLSTEPLLSAARAALASPPA
jgi:hypothetical protein